MDEIKALLIGVLSLSSTIFHKTDFKAFFILLGLKKKVENMVTNLANRLFSYFLIIICNVLPNYTYSANATFRIINRNLFTYITTNRYLYNKFHKIIINTNVFKHFLAN